MESSTAYAEYKDILHVLLCTDHLSGQHWFLISAINFLFSITAIIGNTLILVALHKESSLHPPSKLLYRCLANTDILVGLISEPSAAIYQAFRVTENLSTDLCFYSGVFYTVSFTILSAVSLLTLTTISVDRVLALLLGLRYRHIVTLWRVRALVISFWISSLAISSMIIWNFTVAKSYSYALILLCIIMSTVCYSKIFLTLRHYQTQVHPHQAQSNGGAISQNIARYKTTVFAAVWVLVALVACYLPYSIVIAVITSYGSSPFLDVIWELTATLVYLNSSLNPILYCWKIQEVRQEVKNTITQFHCWANDV
ncbi:adenosine receptor A3-like [Oculina patagonica]